MVFRNSRRGTALLMSMIVLAVLAAWAVAVCSFSGTSVQLANNQHKADITRACAESGLEVIRCWLSQVSISGTTPANQQFTAIATSLQSTAATMSNVAVTYNSTTITIPAITLDSATGRNFSAVITSLDSKTMRVEVTGRCGTITKTIRANYLSGESGSTVFDFGVASKGPVLLGGSVDLEGLNVAVQSNMYIESENEILALQVLGSSKIEGDVSIVRTDADIVMGSGKQCEIGGETGQNAIKDHVHKGVSPSEFPVPNPDYFKQLVTLTNLPANYSNQNTFTNVTIPPNTNPSFAGGATFNGLLVIEPPNQVTFAGNVNIKGIIVGDGDLTDDSETNKITFKGNVSSFDVTQLQGAQFDPLRTQTGTFLMAPGFAVSFGGSVGTVNGTIAANGVDFSGHAGGTIDGSIINYSQNEMTFQGSSTLKFNRSLASTNPSGFKSKVVLQYDPNSYAEGPF